jgi:hypothetical protein
MIFCLRCQDGIHGDCKLRECCCPKIECANSRAYLGSTWLRRKRGLRVITGPPVFDEASYRRVIVELNKSNA